MLVSRNSWFVYLPPFFLFCRNFWSQSLSWCRFDDGHRPEFNQPPSGFQGGGGRLGHVFTVLESTYTCLDKIRVAMGGGIRVYLAPHTTRTLRASSSAMAAILHKSQVPWILLVAFYAMASARSITASTTRAKQRCLAGSIHPKPPLPGLKKTSICCRQSIEWNTRVK